MKGQDVIKSGQHPELTTVVGFEVLWFPSPHVFSGLHLCNNDKEWLEGSIYGNHVDINV